MREPAKAVPGSGSCEPGRGSTARIVRVGDVGMCASGIAVRRGQGCRAGVAGEAPASTEAEHGPHALAPAGCEGRGTDSGGGGKRPRTPGPGSLTRTQKGDRRRGRACSGGRSGCLRRMYVLHRLVIWPRCSSSSSDGRERAHRVCAPGFTRWCRRAVAGDVADGIALQIVCAGTQRG